MYPLWFLSLARVLEMSTHVNWLLGAYTTGKQARENAWLTLPPGVISWHRKEHSRKQQKRVI